MTAIIHQVRSVNSPKNQWDIAPADHEIYSMDYVKPMYRQAVEQYIKAPNKSLYKKPFFTIATNVLGPDVDCSRFRNPSLDDDSLIDIYLPLEISITKWSIRDAKLSGKQRKLETRCWIINPGKVHYTVAHYTRLHYPKHKINFEDQHDVENAYIESDLQKIGREINTFLTADRVVFSQSLQHVRQDLGSLKWLNRELQDRKGALKPISVLNMVDLYILLIRKFDPLNNESIGDAIAKYRLNKGRCNRLCRFHKHLLKADIETPNCARALTIGKTNILLDDLKELGEVFGNENKEV